MNTPLLPRVESEIAPVSQIITHRPGREIDRLTPENKEHLLFDELLWVQKAQEEHDEFTAMLAQNSVEVLDFRTLLAETLAVRQAREYVLTQTFDERVFGHILADTFREYAAGLRPAELADLVIEGMTKGELNERVGAVNTPVLNTKPEDYLVLSPLPNHYFTRDTSCWIYGGVAVSAMQKPARVREVVNVTAVYRFHPRFADAGFSFWTGGLADGAATVEGGDVEVIGNGAVLVGLGERTSPQGMERLASHLFAAHAARQVIGIHTSALRSQMHLDTVLTMVDEGTFVKYGNLGMLPTTVLTPRGDNGGYSVKTHPGEEMHQVIAAALGLDSLRVLSTPTDSASAARDQWNDACNFLTLRPGVVVGYDRNVTANEYLQSQGIEVVAVPGNELGRGRGGARCMSCPTVRPAE